MEPNNIYALYNIGYTKSIWGQYSEALSCFDKVIEISPEFALSYNERGWVKMKMGSLEDGLQDVQQALQLDETISEAYRNLGFYYMERRDLDRAFELFDKAKSMEPEMELIDGYLVEIKQRMSMS